MRVKTKLAELLDWLPENVYIVKQTKPACSCGHEKTRMVWQIYGGFRDVEDATPLAEDWSLIRALEAARAKGKPKE